VLWKYKTFIQSNWRCCLYLFIWWDQQAAVCYQIYVSIHEL